MLIAEETVRLWVLEYYRDGTCTPGRKRGKNKKGPKVAVEHRLFLTNYLKYQDSQLYVTEMISLIENNYNGVRYTRFQIRRALKDERMTLKVVSLEAKERNEQQRAAYQNLIGEMYADGALTSKMAVFVDETHCDIKTARRKYGWALRGQPAFRRVYNLLGHGAKGYSAISSFATDGFRTVTTYDVAIDADRFIATLREEILPDMNAYPGPRSVLFLDNARIHSKPLVEEACNEIGAFVIWLPPYSYDFNPIEEGFHMAKSKIRRDHDVDGVNGFALLKEHLEEAILGCCGPVAACNLFEHSGYPVTAEERAWAAL